MQKLKNKLVTIIQTINSNIRYLLPKHSMMSPVTVDLFLFEKASDAAFLNIADPAMHPKTVGFLNLKQKYNYGYKNINGI